jgi:hypothetical protein
MELAAVLDPEAQIGLSTLERRIETLTGFQVNLVPEPVRDRQLRANIERDGQPAF